MLNFSHGSWMHRTCFRTMDRPLCAAKLLIILPKATACPMSAAGPVSLVYVFMFLEFWK